MATIAEAYSNNQSVLLIPVSQIRPNPYQPRRIFEKDALMELANSIKEYGVMQPITVRRNGDKYELVAGERRLRASKLAEAETIPAIVIEISERDSAFLALMENLQRENLNFLEEAEGYINLMQDYNLTQEEVAAKLGKSQSNIANKIRVLKLPDEIKKILRENALTERHARALLKLPDEKTQLRAVKKILAEGYNVKKTDDYIDSILKRLKNNPKPISKKDVKKFKFYIKDTRIFVNTIKKAVDMVNQAGGDASYSISDSEEAHEILIRINKKTGK